MSRWIFRIFMLSAILSRAGDSLQTLRAGVVIKKYAGFYWMNGGTAEWAPAGLKKQNMSVGLNVMHSGLGSAFGSRALSVLEVDGCFYWDPLQRKIVSPRLGAGVGFVHAALGEGFGNLPNSSMVASIELGCAARISKKINAAFTAGYNLNAGNGMRGAGFVYPVFLQAKILYRLNDR